MNHDKDTLYAVLEDTGEVLALKYKGRSNENDSSDHLLQRLKGVEFLSAKIYSLEEYQQLFADERIRVGDRVRYEETAFEKEK